MNGQLVKPHNVKRGSRVSGRRRAMPETEKPPARLVDIYLKDKGYALWMDDFGSGYSSLNF